CPQSEEALSIPCRREKLLQPRGMLAVHLATQIEHSLLGAFRAPDQVSQICLHGTGGDLTQDSPEPVRSRVAAVLGRPRSIHEPPSRGVGCSSERAYRPDSSQRLGLASAFL